MTEIPIRSLYVSDFRCLEGHRTLPFDAPIVLLHGPNGAGKTSVLSALEMALTGEIRSMRRHDPRYTAHLPFCGQEFATVRAEVSEELTVSDSSVNMTIGGSRIDGPRALDADAAQFYAERCYLDQVSLGQLLELYQYREGKEESALARFVNELLGLEQLDALRSGLSDSTDIRRLRKLSEPLLEADAEVQLASTELSRLAGDLDSERASLERCRIELIGALELLGFDVPEIEGDGFGHRAQEFLRSDQQAEDSSLVETDRLLTALGGRIEALANRPSARRLREARAALGSVSAEFERWREEYGSVIDAWHAEASDLSLDTSDGDSDALAGELRRFDRMVADQDELTERTKELEERVTNRLALLRTVQEELSSAQEQAGSLVEGLAALREHATGNVCPVCDRDFGEVGTVHLSDHIAQKIDELTSHGERLQELRQRRDAITVQVQNEEQLLNRNREQLWSDVQKTQISARRSALADLQERLLSLASAISTGRELDRRRQDAELEVQELETIAHDTDLTRAELENVAQYLGVPTLKSAPALEARWQSLAQLAAERLEKQRERVQAQARAESILERFVRSTERVAAFVLDVARMAERRTRAERQVEEARRRQSVAKSVREASSTARARIVQRVFTESLNEVWRSVFTRLAPREAFVPEFGIPTSSRVALELTLQTVHVSGDPGGSPQMMLSAGNLNTAALSLFVALHLAVEPLVPCLVFDDPVQSMDEVHVSQFAGLIRLLSKHHGRQVIIAVHERELFQYLSLELSPAFEGDELITIELGDRSEDDDQGIRRVSWTSDQSIAV